MIPSVAVEMKCRRKSWWNTHLSSLSVTIYLSLLFIPSFPVKLRVVCLWVVAARAIVIACERVVGVDTHDDVGTGSPVLWRLILFFDLSRLSVILIYADASATRSSSPQQCRHARQCIIKQLRECQRQRCADSGLGSAAVSVTVSFRFTSSSSHWLPYA